MYTPGRGRSGALLLVGLAALALLGGCSKSYSEPAYIGNIFVDNLTDTTTFEDILDFRVAPFGQPFTGNLLVAPVLPGSTQFVGTFHEDYYDAEAVLSGGDFVEWFDIFVGEELDVFFEVF